MKMLVALALAGLIGSASPALADLRSSLAQRFQADPQFFILNLPPGPGGWPGSIFTYDLLSALIQGDPIENAAGSGTLFDPIADIELDLSGEAERRFLPLASLAGNAADTAIAVMSITHVRIVELTVPQVRDRIRTIPKADRRASAPWIVMRSYLGVPLVTFAKKSNADAEAWARLRASLVQANLRSAATSDDKIELRFSEQTVFAFEAWSVDEFSKLADVPDDLTVETALVVVKGPSGGGTDRYKDLQFPAERIPSLDLVTTDAPAILKREIEEAGIQRVEKVFPVSGAGGMYVAFLRQDLSKFGLSRVKAEEFEKVRGKPELPAVPRPMSDPPRQP
jgi:hypothetical protein